MSQSPVTPSGGSDMSFMARLITGIKYVVGNADTAPFGPMQPLAPVFQPDMQGRQWDYQTGINLNYVPRQNEPISFAQLRGLADNYDLLRLAIETRKDQACKLVFKVKPKDVKKTEDSRCKEVDDFFSFPDQEHDWETWLRILLEDLFVIDAVTIYPRMNKGGKLFALEPMDGALIKRVIDAQGRTPIPPQPAYQQYIKGVPAVDYTRETLIYKPRNLRTNRLYGFSQVEQVIMTVNIALRRQIHQLQYYTEGSTPDLLFFCPETWNPDQIKQFQLLWDSLMNGQTATRRQGRFLPYGVTPYDVKQTALKDEYDEWLARIICYAFSLPPTAFVKQMNRASADNQKEQAAEEGLAPIVSYINSLRNLVIWKYFGYTDLESALEESSDIDPLVQAQIDKIYLQEYVVSPDDVRDRLGLEGPAPEKPLPPAMGQPIVEGGTDASAGGNNDGGNVPVQTDKVNSKKTATVDSKKTADKGTDKVAKGSAGGSDKTGAKRSLSGDILRGKKKQIEPIDRDRPAVSDTRDGLQSDLEAFFSVAAEDIATDVSRGIKAGKDSDGIADGLDFKNWDVLINPTKEALETVYNDGGKEAFAQIDFNASDSAFSLLNEKAMAYSEQRAADMVGMRNMGTKGDPIWVENPEAQWAITETTRDNIRSAVSKAIEDGSSPRTLRQSIIDNESFSPARAEMIARTELAIADCKGNMEAYRASGVVTKKVWIYANEGDDRVCDECEANAEDGEIDLEEPFNSGDTEPPAHPDCRCDVIPIVEEMDTEGDGE